MKRPEYDDDANIGDDTYGCPGIMNYLAELEEYADDVEHELESFKKLWHDAVEELRNKE